MKENKRKVNYRAIYKKECCDKPHIAIRNGTKVCLNCGIVKGMEFIQKERRAYSEEEVKKRRRTHPVWRDFGPRTMLPRSNKDHRGHNINSKKKIQLFRLSKIQKSLTTSLERNFWDAKPKMSLISSKLNIPKYVFETGWRIYTTAAKKKLTMGRSIAGFVAASLYVAIRVHEIPRLLEEISDTSLVSRRTIMRSIGILGREILHELNLNYRPITPEQLIFRYGNDLNIPISIQKKALNIFSESSKNGLPVNGKDPKGFAASAIYLAAKPTMHQKTQTEVSEVAKITEVTIRSRIKDIETH